MSLGYVFPLKQGSSSLGRLLGAKLIAPASSTSISLVIRTRAGGFASYSCPSYPRWPTTSQPGPQTGHRQHQPQHHHPRQRTIHTTPNSMSPPPPSDPETKASESEHKQDTWSPKQYLRFDNERTRPVHDLISQVIPLLNLSSSSSQADRDRPLRIYDLGCGPGNSTRALLSNFPSAHITGIDSSSAMIQKARQDFSDGISTVNFEIGDVSTFTPPTATSSNDNPPPDLIFSNAVFHWLRSPIRLPTLTRLLSTLLPGAVLALQVPDNYLSPSHSLMRSVALLPNQPWTPYFIPPGSNKSDIGDLTSASRPDLDPIESPSEIYSALVPYCKSVNVWRTEYFHSLGGAREIVEWVKGTGLMPFLSLLPETGGVREAFLERYEEEVGKAYPRMGDGRCLLNYPRLFVVAVRK